MTIATKYNKPVLTRLKYLSNIRIGCGVAFLILRKRRHEMTSHNRQLIEHFWFYNVSL